MSDFAFEMNNVSKKFRKGEMHDSLRDLLPSMVKGLYQRKETNQLALKEFWALQDISFQIKKGEALGIIGSNGAGKSTMLKLLCGIMKPTKGIMKVNGTLSALIEVGAGFHGDLTGRENIFLNGTILGLKREQIRNKFDEIVEFSGLEDFIDTPVKRYSSGMYARLGFSVAAHVDPDILVVDEVLSVGDMAFQNRCMEKMKSVFNSGATLLFVSHNLHAVAELCNRCILLDHGKLIKDGPATEVVNYYMKPDPGTRETNGLKEAYISNVAIKREKVKDVLNDLLFDTGEKVFIEIEIIGRVNCEKLSVGIVLNGKNDYYAFGTSTERLIGTTISLVPNQKKKIIFELNLHILAGTYHLCTHINRYDIEKTYDVLAPAATFQIRSSSNANGIVNLYPMVSIE